MGKVSTKGSTVAGDALKMAISAVLFCLLLLFLDQKYAALALFDLKAEDVQMMALCAVLFCLLWVGLNKFFFAPYIKLVEAREKATTGAESESLQKHRQAEDLIEQYENRVYETRSAAMKERQTVVSAAKIEANQIVEKAQAEAQELLKKNRNEIASRQVQIKQEASSQAESLSAILVSKVMNNFAIFIGLAIFLMAGTDAFAAGGGHGADHAPAFSDLKFHIINFVLYFAFILYLFYSKVPAAWAARRANIQAALDIGNRKNMEAEAKLQAAQQKFSNLESDVKRIYETMKAETEREGAAIVATAKESAQRISEQARDTVAAEQKSFERVVRRMFAEKALQMTEEKLKGQINKDSDRKFRDKAKKALRDLVIQ